MTYDEIISEAKNDVLDKDEVDLDEAALSIPHLHQKWSTILMEEKLRMRKLTREQNRWLKIMIEYYSGKLSEEELTEYNLEPFALKVLKKDIDTYINADQTLNDFEDIVDKQENLLALIDRKMKEISNRQWYIRCAIDHRKFMSGG